MSSPLSRNPGGIRPQNLQNLRKHVRTFHGGGTAKFQNWLTDMELLAITMDSETMCVLATLKLEGLAATSSLAT